MKAAFATFAPTLLLLAGMSASLAAQTRITLDPPPVEKLVRPGKRLQDSVAFTNDGKVPLEVSISLADFEMNESGEVGSFRRGPPRGA